MDLSGLDIFQSVDKNVGYFEAWRHNSRGFATVDSFLQNFNLQGATNESPKRVGEPESFVVKGSRIKTEDNWRISYLLLQLLNVVLDMSSAFFVSFRYHDNSYIFLFSYLEGEFLVIGLLSLPAWSNMCCSRHRLLLGRKAYRFISLVWWRFFLRPIRSCVVVCQNGHKIKWFYL